MKMDVAAEKKDLSERPREEEFFFQFRRQGSLQWEGMVKVWPRL